MLTDQKSTLLYPHTVRSPFLVHASQVCLACGADPRAAGPDGLTPLLQLLRNYYADASNQDLTPLKLLLPTGAARDVRLRAKSLRGLTPLHYAAANATVLQYLLSILTTKTSELICAEDDSGWQPLNWACYEHCAASVELLLAAGAEPG